MVQLSHCHDQKEMQTAAERSLSRMVKNQRKNKYAMNKKLLGDVSVHCQACFALPWAERLLRKKEALSPDRAP